MQAIILAGGVGRRLGNIVKNTPKPLLKVNKKPFVVKIVERLIDQGIKKIIFCLGYKSKKFINFFGNGSKWRVKISYVVEKKPMGTAGAIRCAYTKISDSNVIVLNGDSFCHFDIPGLLKHHISNHADATISVLRIDKYKSRRYGLISFKKNMKIKKFEEKPKKYKNKNNYINSGVYILNKKIIKKIDRYKPSSLEKDFFLNHLDMNIQAYIIKNNKFIDIGTPSSLKKADLFFKEYRNK